MAKIIVTYLFSSDWFNSLKINWYLFKSYSAKRFPESWAASTSCNYQVGIAPRHASRLKLFSFLVLLTVIQIGYSPSIFAQQDKPVSPNAAQRIEFFSVGWDAENIAADNKLLDIIETRLQVQFDATRRSSNYEQVINDLVSIKDKTFLARVTPYVYITALAQGADLKIIATYQSRTSATEEKIQPQTTYNSFFVVNKHLMDEFRTAKFNQLLLAKIEEEFIQGELVNYPSFAQTHDYLTSFNQCFSFIKDNFDKVADTYIQQRFISNDDPNSSIAKLSAYIATKKQDATFNNSFSEVVKNNNSRVNISNRIANIINDLGGQLPTSAAALRNAALPHLLTDLSEYHFIPKSNDCNQYQNFVNNVTNQTILDKSNTSSESFDNQLILKSASTMLVRYLSNKIEPMIELQNRLKTNNSPTLSEFIDYVKNTKNQPEFIFHNRFSTSSYFLPSIIIRNNELEVKRTRKYDLKSLSGSSSLLPAVEDPENNVYAAVWDFKKNNYQQENGKETKLYFVKLEQNLPNDFLVMSNTTIASKTLIKQIQPVIHNAEINESDIGTWLNWERDKNPLISKAQQALAGLKQKASANNYRMIVKVLPDKEISPDSKFIVGIQQAIRLSRTEFTVYDRSFHKMEDLTLYVRRMHDNLVHIRTEFNVANNLYKQELSQTFPVSFSDIDNYIAKVSNILKSKIHRVSYIWPYSTKDNTIVLRDIDFEPDFGITSEIIVQPLEDYNAFSNSYKSPPPFRLEHKSFTDQAINASFDTNSESLTSGLDIFSTNVDLRKFHIFRLDYNERIDNDPLRKTEYRVFLKRKGNIKAPVVFSTIFVVIALLFFTSFFLAFLKRRTLQNNTVTKVTRNEINRLSRDIYEDCVDEYIGQTQLQAKSFVLYFDLESAEKVVKQLRLINIKSVFFLNDILAIIWENLSWFSHFRIFKNLEAKKIITAKREEYSRLRFLTALLTLLKSRQKLSPFISYPLAYLALDRQNRQLLSCPLEIISYQTLSDEIRTQSEFVINPKNIEYAKFASYQLDEAFSFKYFFIYHEWEVSFSENGDTSICLTATTPMPGEVKFENTTTQFLEFKTVKSITISATINASQQEYNELQSMVNGQSNGKISAWLLAQKNSNKDIAKFKKGIWEMRLQPIALMADIGDENE